MAVIFMIMVAVLMAVIFMIMVAVLMAVIFVLMVVMVMMLFLLGNFRQIDLDAFHRFQDFFPAEFRHRRCDNRRIRIQPAQQRKCFIDFLRGRAVCIRAAQNDGPRGLDLILEKFTEVFQIHFAFRHIHDGRRGIDHEARLVLRALDRMNDIRKFSDAGRFDNDTVRMVFVRDLFECAPEITDQ